MENHTSQSKAERNTGKNQVVLGVLLGLFLSGGILLLSANVKPNPILINPTPTAAPLIVQVSGAVTFPGVYELPPMSRANDAIDLAGGFAADADTAQINAAAFIYDGQQIHVPHVNENAILIDSDRLPTINEQLYPININYCTQAELETLPGIGPQKAAAVISYRDQYGPFSVIEDIMNVPGIGETIFDGIKDFLTVR
ncbi:MAG: helix-hairpin-helix domain-containing protein [Anaerolineae bacterium]|nr:helix-hairpin-helix domain-containing protein [Anaerolineae bacterium]